MERLTTDTPQNNMESAHNIFSIKNRITVCNLTEDGHEITLYDLMRHCAEVLRCRIAYDSGSDDDIGEFLTDQLFDGLDSPEGILAHFFTAAWAFSELRAKLKAYEDTELSPEDVTQVNDFSHSQCARLLAENAKLKGNQLDPLELAKVAIALKENATLKKALELMSEYLGEAVECPAASIGDALWPECNGEDEACGDSRTVGECWKKYFLQRAAHSEPENDGEQK